MTDNVRVGIGACRCPGSPHDEDEVFLAGKATLAVGFAAHQAIGLGGEDTSFLTVNIGRAFVRYGVVSWNLLTLDEESGRTVPLPVTPDVVEEQLPWAAGGEDVAVKAMELYYDSVIRPLVERSQTRSPSGPMEPLTSVSPLSSSSSPSSPKPSSPESSDAMTSSPETSISPA